MKCLGIGNGRMTSRGVAFLMNASNCYAVAMITFRTNGAPWKQRKRFCRKHPRLPSVPGFGDVQTFAGNAGKKFGNMQVIMHTEHIKLFLLLCYWRFATVPRVERRLVASMLQAVKCLSYTLDKCCLSVSRELLFAQRSCPPLRPRK
jgi:hypothetical protein